MMVTAPQPPSTIHPVERISGRQADTTASGVPTYDTSFDGVLVALQSLPAIDLTLSSPGLPPIGRSLDQVGLGPRKRRLMTLRREDAHARLNGASRISGASRSAMEEASSHDRRADRTPSKRQVRNSNRGLPSSDERQPLQKVGNADTRHPGILADPGRSAPSRRIHVARNTPDGAVGKTAGATAKDRSLGTEPGAPATGSAVEPDRAFVGGTNRPNGTTGKRVARAPSVGGGGHVAARSGTPQGDNNVLRVQGRDSEYTEKADINKSRAPRRKPTEVAKPRQSRMFERIAKVLRAKAGSTETVARIRLDPPELGHLRINMRLKNDTLRLRLMAERDPAREALRSRMDELRAALERQGLRVEKMDFPAPPDGDGRATAFVPDRSQDTSARRRDTRQRNGDGRTGSYRTESPPASPQDDDLEGARDRVRSGGIEVHAGLDVRV